MALLIDPDYWIMATLLEYIELLLNLLTYLVCLLTSHSVVLCKVVYQYPPLIRALITYLRYLFKTEKFTKDIALRSASALFFDNFIPTEQRVTPRTK